MLHGTRTPRNRLADIQKHLRDLDLKDVVNIHLSTRPIVHTLDFMVQTCLESLDSSARHTRGNDNTRIYAPVLCAFAILDQIGSCYADKAMTPHPNGGSGIHRALYYFCQMSPMSEEVKALYAFRNGLIHDGSFTSQAKTTGQWYMFRYSNSLQVPIKLAQNPWDGTGSGLNGAVTFINMRIFTDMVFAGLQRLRDLNEKRNSDLQVNYTRDDILHKFLLWVSPPDLDADPADEFTL